MEKHWLQYRCHNIATGTVTATPPPTASAIPGAASATTAAFATVDGIAVAAVILSAGRTPTVQLNAHTNARTHVRAHTTSNNTRVFVLEALKAAVYPFRSRFRPHP